MSEKTKNILLIIAAVIILLLVTCSVFIYRKYQNANSQIVMWNDSTYYYMNKYNEEYLAKNTYIMKADELQKYSDSLYAEYESLKDHPVMITKTKVITRIDTIRANIDSLWTDSMANAYAWHWSAADSCWYNIQGRSMLKRDSSRFRVYTDITKLYVENGITLDLIDDGTQLAVIAKSNNPYSDIDNIQSVVIDPTKSKTLSNYFKPKRWGFGPYVGVCVYTGYGWMPNSGNSPGFQVGVGGSIGFSIHYDLIQW